MAHFTANWIGYRAWRAVQVASFAVLIGFQGLLFAETRWSDAHRILDALDDAGVFFWIWGAALAGVLFSSLVLINWRCPQCREYFAYPSSTGRACQFCGLRKFATEPHVARD